VGICVSEFGDGGGVVGILKAGGAYVPLDPGYPAERLRYMLEEQCAAVLLSKGI